MLDAAVNMAGRCQCGCGEKTVVVKKTSRRDGYAAGEFRRFVKGHYSKTRPRVGVETRKDGYRLLFKPDNERSNKRGYILEHVFIAQQALGKILPRNAVVHHFSKKITESNDVSFSTRYI